MRIGSAVFLSAYDLFEGFGVDEGFGMTGMTRNELVLAMCACIVLVVFVFAMLLLWELKNHVRVDSLRFLSTRSAPRCVRGDGMSYK